MEEFDENLPYISLDFDISDVKLIQEAVAQTAKSCHHDVEKKESLKYLEDFLNRVVLEYHFKVD